MTGDLILSRLRRMLLLDSNVFTEVYDDRRFTTIVAGLMGAAVFIAGLGAYLYGETVLDYRPDDWFLDTVILGSLFTIILFAVGITVSYLVLAQVFSIAVTLDGLARVLAMTYTIYALGFFVFLPEIGFTFGALSIAAMLYYAVYGVRAVTPNSSAGAALVATGAGFVVWITVLALISDPGDNFFTGAMVYSVWD